MKRFILATLLAGLSNLAIAQSNTYTSVEYRTPIPVTAQERNQVLYEMRSFLHGMHNIHHDLARKDMKSLAQEVKPMSKVLDRFPADLRERLPEAFMQMGHGLRESFVQMAKIAEGNGSVEAVQEQLAEVITYCAGCHDTYRFEVVLKPPKP